MTSNQPPIPGLEASSFPLLISYNPRRKATGWPNERIGYLEKRISALEVELAILKIQMEKDYA